ncbi:hypothetical protein ACXR2U_04405 [Jatrophihabitans sp. YIM 134969]
MSATLAPRAVVVYRRTELADLLARHGTRGGAAFYLAQRGRDIADVEADDAAHRAARQAVSAAVPVEWRRGEVERADLARFLFAPGDVVVAVGADGVVANVAKYLAGQPVVGIDPQPGRGVGALVSPASPRLRTLLEATVHDEVGIEHRTMVRVVTDDGQELTALNEIYLGHASHQTARYRLTVDGREERQASSGLLVGSGTGATGWCASTAGERHSTLALPTPTEQRLAWFVREAWPSPTTGTTLTEGVLEGRGLDLQVESDHLVAFGDGVEADHLDLLRGQRARLDVSPRTLTLVRP